MRHRDIREGLKVVALVWMASALTIILMMGLAWGHHADSGWLYPSPCCTPHEDCKLLDRSQVEITDTGYYIIPLDRMVPYGEANSSPDGRYHYCAGANMEMEPYLRTIDPQGYEVMNRSGVCFWAPEGSV